MSIGKFDTARSVLRGKGRVQLLMPPGLSSSAHFVTVSVRSRGELKFWGKWNKKKDNKNKE